MDSDKTFTALRLILEEYEPKLIVAHNKSDHYYLNTPSTNTNKKPEFFGAAQIKKSYVAFHLMPVYYYPELLESMSEDLKKHMQGKSCFNFKYKDEKLLSELKMLTKNSFHKYKSLGKI